MLYYPQGFTKPLRVQGAFVTDDEVAKVVDFLSKHNESGTYSEEIQEKIASAEIGTGSGGDGDNAAADSRDAYFEAAGRLLIEKEKGSIGMLQRNLKSGLTGQPELWISFRRPASSRRGGNQAQKGTHESGSL